MRIVFLSRYQKTISRGVESFVTELSSRLSEDFEVDVLSGKDADSLYRILQGKYDIVVPMNGRIQGFMASFGRIIGGYRTVIIGESGVGIDAFFNVFFSKPDTYVALTDFMVDWVKRFAWGSKVVKIPNGVDIHKFNPKGVKMTLSLKGPIVLSVGALVWYKHHERTIDALEDIPEASLLIVGQGEKKEELERLCQEKLGDRFLITSAKFEDTPKIYRSADIFTLPSWDREAFGIVYLEAMASGLGVVAPDDSSRKEIVGDGGILANVEDKELFAKALRRALSEKWLLKSRKQAEKFSWENIAISYKKLFLQLGER